MGKRSSNLSEWIYFTKLKEERNDSEGIWDEETTIRPPPPVICLQTTEVIQQAKVIYDASLLRFANYIPRLRAFVPAPGLTIPLASTNYPAPLRTSLGRYNCSRC